MAVHLTLGPVARARNGVIGRGDALPWRLSADMRRFRKLTLGKPVIMGRKTWESLPRANRPLKGRLNVVLSRQAEYEAVGAVVCDDFAEALEIAREQAAEDGQNEVCVIGGADLFALSLPRAHRIYLTEVDGAPDGDVVMAALDETGWREVLREAVAAGPEDEFATVFRVLERSPPP
ncbi:MAG TPA: dihydrofolate reductase [Caulobacteraceae bacterium]